MNTNHWMTQKLNDEHQRQMRAVAEREQAAQSSRNEPSARPQRRLLSKLYAEMSELADRWEKTEPIATNQLQRQS